MNKVIKFRGKSVENFKWIYGFFVEDMGKSFILAKEKESDYRLSWFEVDPNTVSQLTPLIDSKKHEIFEQDIIGGNDRINILINHVVQGEYNITQKKITNMNYGIVGNTIDNMNILK
jgi:uncharacterized phage protein (TIGR01671 family)